MIYPSADILERWGSKYSLVVLAAKRAKQLKSGAPPLISTTSRNPLTIALEEIAAGKVLCQVADHDILPKSTQEAEVAQLLAIPTLSVEEEEVPGESEAAAVLADDTGLVSEEDEEEEAEDEAEEELEPLGVLEEEHEVGFVADIDEEEEEPVEEEDDEAEVVSEETDEAPGIIPPEEPKPKARRGRKPKAAAVPELLPEEPEITGLEIEESEE